MRCGWEGPFWNLRACISGGHQRQVMESTRLADAANFRETGAAFAIVKGGGAFQSDVLRKKANEGEGACSPTEAKRPQPPLYATNSMDIDDLRCVLKLYVRLYVSRLRTSLLPRSANIGFKLFLPCLYPRTVMTLYNFRSIAEQYSHPLRRNSHH